MSSTKRARSIRLGNSWLGGAVAAAVGAVVAGGAAAVVAAAVVAAATHMVVADTANIQVVDNRKPQPPYATGASLLLVYPNEREQSAFSPMLSGVNTKVSRMQKLSPSLNQC